MDKFSVNFGALEEHLRPKAPVYKYEDVKHRLRKVAFDIVRFVDADNIDGLWQIQNTDDGEVIVAMYSEEAPAEKTASASAWRAIADRSGNVNLFYKNDPVTKVSLAKLGMADADPDAVCVTLAENLQSNSKLLDGLLASLSSEERKDLLGSHPELVSCAESKPMFEVLDNKDNQMIGTYCEEWLPNRRFHANPEGESRGYKHGPNIPKGTRLGKELEKAKKDMLEPEPWESEPWESPFKY